MGKKNKPKGVAVASSSSGEAFNRRYSLADLEPAFVRKIQEYHTADYENLYTQLPKLQKNGDPDPVSDELKRKIIELQQEFQAVYDQFCYYDKYKNLTDSYINSNYFRCIYACRIGVLHFYLGQKPEAFKIMHQAIMANNHPQQIYLLYWLEYYKLYSPDETLIYTYYENTIRGLISVTGNVRQNNDIKSEIESYGCQSKYAFLNIKMHSVFMHYQHTNQLDKMEDFLDFLYKRFDTIVWLQNTEKKGENSLLVNMQSFLYELVRSKVKDKKWKELDPLFERFEKCVGILHYKLVSLELFHEMVADMNNIDILRMYLRYLAPIENSGDLEATLSKASVLLHNVASVLKDKSAPEKAKTLILNILSKLHTIDASRKKFVEASCYHSLGFFYEQFVPINSREGKTKKDNMIRYYTKALELDNLPSAMKLVFLYGSGDMGDQDLDKAENVLDKIKNIGDKSWVVRKLANVKLLKSSLPKNASIRKELLQQGIDLIKNHLDTEKNITNYELIELNYHLSLLLIAFDTGINKKVYENGTFVYDVLCSNEISDIEEKTYANAEKVHDLLEQNIACGHMSSYYLMGLLTHYGTYLKEDFSKAHECYKICQDAGNNVAEEMAGLNLVLHAQENDVLKKKEYLLKAISYHRLSVELAPSMDCKLWLEENFSMLVHSFLENQTSLTPKNKQKVALRAKGPYINRQQPELQLESAIEAVENHLKTIGIQNQNFESTLIALLDAVSFVLLNSKAQIPLLVDFFPDLNNLIQTLNEHFIKFELKTKINVIKNISYWPLIAEENGPLATMLTLTRLKEDTELGDRLSVSMAIIQLKHRNGTFINETIRILRHQYKVGTLGKISNAARILHLWAIIHVNCSDAKIKEYLEIDITNGKEDVLSFIANHNTGMNPEDLSKIYHGLHYLSIAFPDQFLNFDPRIQKLLDFSAQLLQQPDSVTISRMQQNTYCSIKKLDPRFQHEVFIGGRPVDFYNPETNEIGFLHGPMHYLYSNEGEPLTLKPATELCEQSLRLQGFKVFRIDYFVLGQQQNEEQRLDVLRNIIPSLKSKSPTLTGVGSSSSAFFNSSNSNAKPTQVTTVCATINAK